MDKFKTIIAAAAVSCLPFTAQAQQKIHSHNDYRQEVPFYEAYSQGIDCIECDMFHIKGSKFLVGHDMKDLDEAMTFDKVYLKPVVNLFRNNGGHAWLYAPGKKLTLMVEIKSKDPKAYLKALRKKLSGYRDVFDPKSNPDACGLMITGYNLPYDSFTKYPAYFKFDVQYTECDGKDLSPEQMAHVATFSTNFSKISKWNGKGEFSTKDRETVQRLIDEVHSMGKGIRFWGAPDTEEAWKTFSEMGVDYINTDHVEACASFFRK